MSSILRALKKLESEMPHPADVLSLPRKIDTKKTISRQAKRLLRLRVLSIALGGAVVLTAALWFITSQNASRFRKPAPDASRNTAGASGVTTPVASKAKKQKMLSTIAKVIKDTPQKAVNQVDKALIPTASPPKTVSRDKAERGSKVAAIRTPSRKADLRPKSLTPIEGTQLILQAISWDKNSENRIAVINNRIVREGESVDGFIVTLIGEDDVSVRKGGNEWKLMFRLK